MKNNTTMKIKEGKFWHLSSNGDEFVFNSKSEAVEKVKQLDEISDQVSLREIESDDGSGKFSIKAVSWKEVAGMMVSS